jgi:hypothetical protein
MELIIKGDSPLKPEEKMTTEPSRTEIAASDIGVSKDLLGQDEVDLSKHLPDDVAPAGDAPQQPRTLAEVAEEYRQKRIHELRKLYNGFLVKDITFEAFVDEMTGLTNPRLIRRDAEMIVAQRMAGQQNKTVVDKVLSGVN